MNDPGECAKKVLKISNDDKNDKMLTEYTTKQFENWNIQ